MRNWTNRAERSEEAAGRGLMQMLVHTLICCLGIMLVLVLIPLLGWPLGLTLGVAGFVGMVFAHRSMGQGHHH